LLHVEQEPAVANDGRLFLFVIPGWSQRVGAFAPPDDRLRTRPQVRQLAHRGISSFPDAQLRI
jgi:hypothetical protein